MSRTFTIEVGSVVLETFTCIKCGAPYAFSKEVASHQRKRGGYHWCPICGYSQGWEGQSRDQERAAEIAALKAEASRAAERERRARQDAEHFERSRNAYKGQLTKTRRKVANGVCPCCNRTFSDLQRHMLSKHPEFVTDANAEANPQ